MTDKVIFLDIDGPMIPLRCYVGNLAGAPEQFDPLAVRMLNHLIALSGAKIVMSSAWAVGGYSYINRVLQENGIHPKHLHKDWITPRDGKYSRQEEIQRWLDKHPEVTHYAALDDDPVDRLPGGVQIDFEDGFRIADFRKAVKLLGVTDSRRLEAV